MHNILCLTFMFMTLMQLGKAGMDNQYPRNNNLDEMENRIVTNINDFGYKLLKNMMKKYPNQNIVISPASISNVSRVQCHKFPARDLPHDCENFADHVKRLYKDSYGEYNKNGMKKPLEFYDIFKTNGLLAMTLLGSVRRSYDELAEALGFSEDMLTNRQNHETFGSLLSRINSNDISSKTMFADAVFVDKMSQLREAYRSYIQRVYMGEVLNVDFNETEQTKQFINQWVSRQTEGKIDEFLKETLPRNTEIVLLSALYFSGQWAKPFLPEFTKKMEFSRGDDKILADLMLNLGHFYYLFSAKDDLHMIALPYNDSVTTMYALKPRLPQKLSLSDLLARIDYANIDSFIDQLTKQDVVLRFPKMEIKSDYNLESHLKELGIQSMFNPKEANFALMLDTNKNAQNDLESRSLNSDINSLPNPGVYVDTVMHQVKIKIDGRRPDVSRMWPIMMSGRLPLDVMDVNFLKYAFKCMENYDHSAQFETTTSEINLKLY